MRKLGTTDRPDAYAHEVIQQIIPDTLPYQIGTPTMFGFTDFNGRRLGDNAPEVMFSLVLNAAWAPVWASGHGGLTFGHLSVRHPGLSTGMYAWHHVGGRTRARSPETVALPRVFAVPRSAGVPDPRTASSAPGGVT
ncbi:hypothetical protein [Paractinoplanes hotanensis]|uniref:Uncharacterized protein n=1 Tax=Paractinoplanes hotanensis TaxID=2906497 RepID=A0ABT0Y8C3_9ACTN|nr:hypothetical protein [Actinoplanes hotanensis]MCM4082284.1 hypothetical protein [Actinoplanes hotanensis]